jgi:hypothetical protein
MEEKKSDKPHHKYFYECVDKIVVGGTYKLIDPTGGDDFYKIKVTAYPSNIGLMQVQLLEYNENIDKAILNLYEETEYYKDFFSSESTGSMFPQTIVEKYKLI